MSTTEDLARTWISLSNAQRLDLINQTVPREQQRGQTVLTSRRALQRRGLAWRGGLTPLGEETARWALGTGHARREDETWLFTAPTRERRRIDPGQLRALAAEGLYATLIAKRLGVSREAVRQAARRHDVEIQPKPVAAVRDVSTCPACGFRVAQVEST